jgi:hypothetical protein
MSNKIVGRKGMLFFGDPAFFFKDRENRHGMNGCINTLSKASRRHSITQHNGY